MWILIIVLIIAAMIFGIVYHSRKENRILEARGGAEYFYADLIDAIQQKCFSVIEPINNFIFTAEYLNDSDKRCKLNVITTSGSTSISLYILYNNKWVRVQQTSFYKSLAGKDLLNAIILNFPDCDL